MRAIVIDRFGGPDIVRVAEVPGPGELGRREVLVRMANAGVNPADWKECAGELRHAVAYTFPYIPGFEGSGVIVGVGSEVTEAREGQRVMFARGVGQQGTWAELTRIDVDQVHILSAGIDFARASMVPTAGSTAYQNLFAKERGALVRGQSVLIHGGAGGVGTFAVQMAKDAGLAVAATCRTENVEYVRSLGADCVIDYKSEAIVKTARAWRPEGVDAVIDAVSCGTFPDSLDALKAGGRLVSIATLVGDGDIESDTKDAARRGFKKIFSFLQPPDLQCRVNPLVDLLERGAVTVPSTRVFSMEDIPSALELIKTGHVRGKLSIEIWDGRS